MKSTFTLAALMAATTSNASRTPAHNCCQVWAGKNFMSFRETYCLEESTGRQAAFEIEHVRDVWTDGSIKCGSNVDALVCPNGYEFGPIDGQREFGYKCASETGFVEQGVKAGAG